MADEIKVLLEAIKEAGDAILLVQKKGVNVAHKANHDLVTEADIKANEILKKTLLSHFPKDGWLSEESVDDDTRMKRHRVWIVDPIDGTREFVQGIPEYAISVALVEEGIPLLSAIYNPAREELFYAVKGQGSWTGQQRIYCKSIPSGKNLLLLASRSEYARGEWKNIAMQFPVTQVGSIAYKLALIAAGEAQATFSLGPKHEWDIAAGVLLVTEAGGKVSTKWRERIKFNQKNTEIDSIVATAKENYEHILSLIKAETTG